MIVKAYAKINLALNITKTREDGYHDLDMIMLPIELHDSIDILPLPEQYETYVTCDDFSLETGEYNLCTITIRKMKEMFKIKKNFRIHIHKNIPIGAGLGGGSADAAAVIHGIETLLKLKIDEKEKMELAQSIGADVPFCLKNIPMRVQGIGNKFSPIEIKDNIYVLILKPQIGLSTKEVYQIYDIIGSKKHADIEKLIELLKEGYQDYSLFMGNDLEEAAISKVPEIQSLKDELVNDGFQNIMMTGSGSAVFALSNSKMQIEKEKHKFEKRNYQVYVTKILKE